MRQTKIIATLGPATEDEETISKLIDIGVDLFRFNLKHDTHRWHKNTLDLAKKLANSKRVTVGYIADLQGPEMIIDDLPGGRDRIELVKGQKVIFSKEQLKKDILTIQFNYMDKITNISRGALIYIDDGKVELKVNRVGENFILTEVIDNCVLINKKSISIPSAEIKTETLTRKDKEDIKFAIENKFDYLALSYVRGREDIATLRRLVTRLGSNIKIISKIETIKAVHNFNEILDESDAIMFARGDLGIEIPMEKLPKLQKDLIMKSRERAKPIIVATQMLQSMQNSPLPTRAEVADIANAVFDKTDAIMLSEETAIGKNPIKAVQIMSRIANYNEDQTVIENLNSKPESYQEILINSSMRFIQDHPKKEDGIKGFIVFTETGKSARMVSRFRANLPIYAFSKHESTQRTLCLSYGVLGFCINLKENPVPNIEKAIEILKEKDLVFSGDRLVVIFGNNIGVPEVNNNLSLIRV